MISSSYADSLSPWPRVRAVNPVITGAIANGFDRSTTLRRLAAAIDVTDGIVYITEGRCGSGVHACLHLSVEIAGSFYQVARTGSGTFETNEAVEAGFKVGGECTRARPE